MPRSEPAFWRRSPPVAVSPGAPARDRSRRAGVAARPALAAEPHAEQPILLDALHDQRDCAAQRSGAGRRGAARLCVGDRVRHYASRCARQCSTATVLTRLRRGRVCWPIGDHHADADAAPLESATSPIRAPTSTPRDGQSQIPEKSEEHRARDAEGEGARGLPHYRRRSSSRIVSGIQPHIADLGLAAGGGWITRGVPILAVAGLCCRIVASHLDHRRRRGRTRRSRSAEARSDRDAERAGAPPPGCPPAPQQALRPPLPTRRCSRAVAGRRSGLSA